MYHKWLRSKQIVVFWFRCCVRSAHVISFYSITIFLRGIYVKPSTKLNQTLKPTKKPSRIKQKRQNEMG